MSGGPICKPIRICYQTICKNVIKKICEYSITLKRINDILKGKQNVVL